jgi:hypothetical protein
MSLLYAQTQATDSRSGLGKLVTICLTVGDTRTIGPPSLRKARKTK